MVVHVLIPKDTAILTALPHDHNPFHRQNLGHTGRALTVNHALLSHFAVDRPSPLGYLYLGATYFKRPSQWRRLPAACGRVIAVLGSCHDRPWGALGIIDRARGLDGRSPIVRAWPPEAAALAKDEGEGLFDAYTLVRLKYEDPFPLSDRFFLCSRMTGEGEKMRIYLIDTFGNEILLHAEGAGCHENRLSAPPATYARTRMALRQPPRTLEGWRGLTRPFNYRADVQPVFDKYCVSCHDFGKPVRRPTRKAEILSRKGSKDQSWLESGIKSFANSADQCDHI